MRDAPPPASTRLRIGQVHYELVRRIGGGALGDVYLARATAAGLESMVCVKRLSALAAPESARALREEARLLARIRHANVVSLLAVGDDRDGTPFLVLELIDGADLHALATGLHERGETIADGVAVHVACDLLRALSAVQRQLPGLVHRDVTPHNVLVSKEGEVKLGDFGIARAVDRAAAAVPWTRPQNVKGKLGYMSPEQIRGRALDPRSDLFAVGVVLYELLCGERPWGPVRGIRELRAVIDRPFVPIAARRPQLTASLGAAVERLIAPDPDHRFADAEDALRSLAPFGAGDMGSIDLAAGVRNMQG